MNDETEADGRRRDAEDDEGARMCVTPIGTLRKMLAIAENTGAAPNTNVGVNVGELRAVLAALDRAEAVAAAIARPRDTVRADIAEENPDALFADGLDSALIGAARRCGQPTLAAYSYTEAIKHFMGDDLSYEEAVEHMEFNVVGAWVGPHTPIWIE